MICVPDKIGTEIGWRGWHVKRQGARVFLASVVQKVVWPGGEPLEAFCPKTHVAPGRQCTCGVYAARTLEHLREIDYHAEGVLGEVHLWGSIVPGELGWRAQYAYPKQLYVPHKNYLLAAPLKLTYGVPVRILNPYTGEAK